MLIMTLNLRFENDRDGENGWLYRRDLVVRLIKQFSPWLLGTQEGTPRQLDYLQSHLPEYRMIAPPRPADDTCQYPTIFCRSTLFRVQGMGDLWLSKTPAVHRSKDWDSAFPRMMSYCLLEDVEGERRMCAVVTHLDHIGTVARMEQAKIIADWLNQRQEPRILMGDFNEAPGSALHGFLTGAYTALKDTWQVLEKEEDESSMTHHDFKGVPQRCRMDWILISGAFHVKAACIVRNNSEGRYPSDHFPYAVELDWAC